MVLALGCIADDFTGATDLANTLTRGGLRTVQVNGVPRADLSLPEADAVVVALKSRTAPVREAVDQSLGALAWLRVRGADRFLFKVCSTFDSTDAGNIGPVADALLDALGGDLALVCPAFPANGRTVYQGHLFVGSQLLSDSPMRDHPLTPMRDASLVRVLGRQTRHKVGPAAARVRALRRRGRSHRPRSPAVRRHPLRDRRRHRRRGPAASSRRRRGTCRCWWAAPASRSACPRTRAPAGPLRRATAPRPTCRAAVRRSSSQAVARRRRARRWTSFARAHPARRLDAAALVAGDGELDAATRWLREHVGRGPCLIHSSAAPADVQALQDSLGAEGRERAAAAIEAAFAHLARQAVAAGVRRLVVAGGETSGAVVQALGIEALAIGAEIDPGVPWTATPGPAPLALALKSGNFGSVDFFAKALAATDAG